MFEVLRAIPLSQLRLLVFDLDGTLIDSRRDLANAVNAMLATLGRAGLPESVIGSYIGDGASMLVRRALGDPADETYVSRALELFLVSYRKHMLDHTFVYPSVMSALDLLGTGRQMAVLTNKPVRPSEEICEALGLSPYFFAVYGGNSFRTKKPDPEGLLRLVAEAGVRPDETVMIGDSEVDVLTARAAGAWSVGCSYGLSPRTIESMRASRLVDAVVDTAADWPSVFGMAAPAASR